MKGVTLIPFRKGSKGLKDKACALLGPAETLTMRTIRQANDAGIVPILYSDYEYIRPDGKGLKYEILKREAVSDAQTTEEMLLSYITAYRKDLDYISFMTVNTPVRKTAWILECIEIFKKGYDSFIVEPFYKQLWYNYGREEDCEIWGRMTDGKYGPRQTTKPSGYLEHTGVFCIMKPEHVTLTSRFKLPVKPVIVTHPHVGLDIHTQEDLDYANYLYDRGKI